MAGVLNPATALGALDLGVAAILLAAIATFCAPRARRAAVRWAREGYFARRGKARMRRTVALLEELEATRDHRDRLGTKIAKLVVRAGEDNVPIAEIARRSGLSKERVVQILKDASGGGSASGGPQPLCG
jgi:hypothetical protein